MWPFAHFLSSHKSTSPVEPTGEQPSSPPVAHASLLFLWLLPQDGLLGLQLFLWNRRLCQRQLVSFDKLLALKLHQGSRSRDEFRTLNKKITGFWENRFRNTWSTITEYLQSVEVVQSRDLLRTSEKPIQSRNTCFL